MVVQSYKHTESSIVQSLHFTLFQIDSFGCTQALMHAHKQNNNYSRVSEAVESQSTFGVVSHWYIFQAIQLQ